MNINELEESLRFYDRHREFLDENYGSSYDNNDEVDMTFREKVTSFLLEIPELLAIFSFTIVMMILAIPCLLLAAILEMFYVMIHGERPE